MGVRPQLHLHSLESQGHSWGSDHSYTSIPRRVRDTHAGQTTVILPFLEESRTLMGHTTVTRTFLRQSVTLVDVKCINISVKSCSLSRNTDIYSLLND